MTGAFNNLTDASDIIRDAMVEDRIGDERGSTSRTLIEVNDKLIRK